MDEQGPQASLSPAEEESLACVLDEIIPADAHRGLPGAGELGIAARISRENPDLAPLISQGLAALDEAAQERGASRFAALSGDQKLELLNRLASAQPAFLPGLIFQTYVRYYQHARVVEALGLEARPPHPLGYPMQPTDPSRLDRVRRRPKLYRDV